MLMFSLYNCENTMEPKHGVYCDFFVPSVFDSVKLEDFPEDNPLDLQGQNIGDAPSSSLSSDFLFPQDFPEYNPPDLQGQNIGDAPSSSLSSDLLENQDLFTQNSCGHIVETPSKTLLVLKKLFDADDGEYFELFGNAARVRAVFPADMYLPFQGTDTASSVLRVSFLDEIIAQRAMASLQNQPFRDGVLEMYYYAESDEALSAATLIFFDSLDIALSKCHSLFSEFGSIKRICFAPDLRHKLIEFSDLLDAKGAIKELHGARCLGKERRIEVYVPNLEVIPYPYPRRRIGNADGYRIDLARIHRGDDVRRNLMLKNIPLRYSEENVLSLVDESHAGKYESFHMPTNGRGWNFGYAFIRLSSPSFVFSFYRAFNGRAVTGFGSKKILEVSYAATG